MLETFSHDIRHGLRLLRKAPGFTSIAILTLALGIGANTAIFTVVNSVLLRPLPYRDADRLMILTEKTDRPQPSSLSYLNFKDWREQNRSFSALSIFRDPVTYNLLTSDGPTVITARMVSGDFFSTLGVTPLVGRDFSPSDDRQGAAPTAILSYAAWQDFFGSDPAILGKPLAMNSSSFAIIGVLPHDFTFYSDSDVYIPVGLSREGWTTLRQHRAGFNAVGRLEPGITLAQAQSDMSGIASRLAALYPEANAKRGAAITPIFRDVIGDIGGTLYLLLGAVGLVLLIACANVANLLLARGAARQKEIAIRAALGASRSRVARQLITESVLLGIAGGIAGVFLAVAGTKTLIGVVPGSLPRASSISVDWRALVFALTASILTGIVFGLAPAWQALRTDVQESLQEGSHGSKLGHRRTQRLLAVAEIALALILLIGARLTLRSMAKLLEVQPGFDSHSVLSFKVFLSPSEYPTGEQVHNFYRHLEEKLRLIPGVEGASMAMGNLPLDGGAHVSFYVSEHPKPEAEAMPSALGYVDAPDYLRVMGIRLLQGRFFDAQDVAALPGVVVIDSTLARTVFPEESPIGKHLVIGLPGSDQPLEIVGVVNHVKHWGLDADDHAAVQNQFYISCEQLPEPIYAAARQGLMMVMRSKLPPSAMLPAIEDAVHQLDRRLPLYHVETMDERVMRSLASRRFAALLLALFAGVSFILAAIGIYGVTSCSVNHRTREIGIRVALGAQPRDILWMVLGEGGQLALTGIVLGLAASFALTRLIEKLLFGISTTDPLTYALVASSLFAVALAASYFPARRAMSIEPMSAMRYGFSTLVAPEIQADQVYTEPSEEHAFRVRPLRVPTTVSSAAAIETRELAKTYTSFRGKIVPALEGVSLRVERGTIFGLIGQNGAGKTTLVKILLGLATPSSGTASLLGGSPSDPNIRRRVGYLPEQMRLPEELQAKDLLHYMGRLNGVDCATLGRRIPELLEKAGLAETHKPIKSFSKGMRQRLGLAQALVNDPELLFLDEPTDGLDPLGRKDVRDLLVRLRAEGKTILLNSHLLSEAESVCDEIAILNRGKVACKATPEEFMRGTGEHLLRVTNLDDRVHAAVESILGADGASQASWQNTTLKFRPLDLAQLNALLDRLRTVPVEIVSIEPVKLSLEQFFAQILREQEPQ
jgi:predicted permease